MTTPRKPSKPKAPEGWAPPSCPSPRQRYVARDERIPSPNGGWDSCRITVSQLAGEPIGQTDITTYERNHDAMYETFEPFRQGDRDYALISANYQWTSVLDLETGEIVAEEKLSKGEEGFCPAAFFVPDWWDVHGPGLGFAPPSSWKPDYAWPVGHFGLVLGCYWGAPDFSLQHLDLSRIKQGVVSRDSRFGYLPLELENEQSLHQLIKFNGKTRVFRAPLEVVCQMDGQVYGPFRYLNVPAEYLPQPPTPAAQSDAPKPILPARWIKSGPRRRNKPRR